MTVYSPLTPVSIAVYAALNVAALTALATVVGDNVGQNQVYPFVYYEVSDDTSPTGLGTKAGRGLLSAVNLRVYVYSKYAGMREAQTVMAKVIELLTADDALTASLSANGYRLCGREPFQDDTTPFPDSVVAGESVRELVTNFRIYVEEA